MIDVVFLGVSFFGLKDQIFSFYSRSLYMGLAEGPLALPWEIRLVGTVR